MPWRISRWLLACDLGSPATMFKKMQEHLRMGDGCSWPRGWALCLLIILHAEPQIHLCLCIKVLVTPRCHERNNACPHFNTSDHTGLGRKRWPYGPLAGLGCCSLQFSFPLDSCQRSRAGNDGFRPVLHFWSIKLSQEGTEFLEPGPYGRMNSKFSQKRAYQAQCGVIFLPSWM